MNFLTSTLLSLAVFVTALTPAVAAELSIETPLGGAASTLQVPVVFTADNEAINVVEGSIKIPEGIMIESLDTSSSAFSLFASGPTYVISSHSVEFTAGAPTGIAPNEVALLFIINARAEAEGSYVFAPNTVHAYTSDGNGSRIEVDTRDATLAVGAKGSVSVDPLPKGTPQPLIAEVGKDASLFEGKWFATFYGGADGSSIDHYEVREGWWRFPVRVDRYFVLNDQSRSTTVWVTAVGTDGSRMTVALAPENPWSERLVLTFITLLAALGAYLLYRHMRKNH